jgi:predicted nucleic acid-binding Zn ribbon protein
MNGSDTNCGRRIDLLVASEQDDDSDYELCSVEFKKANVDEATMIKQQSKNLRINCCILK